VNRKSRVHLPRSGHPWPRVLTSTLRRASRRMQDRCAGSLARARSVFGATRPNRGAGGSPRFGREPREISHVYTAKDGHRASDLKECRAQIRQRDDQIDGLRARRARRWRAHQTARRVLLNRIGDFAPTSAASELPSAGERTLNGGGTILPGRKTAVKLSACPHMFRPNARAGACVHVQQNAVHPAIITASASPAPRRCACLIPARKTTMARSTFDGNGRHTVSNLMRPVPFFQAPPDQQPVEVRRSRAPPTDVDEICVKSASPLSRRSSASVAAPEATGAGPSQNGAVIVHFVRRFPTRRKSVASCAHFCGSHIDKSIGNGRHRP
jgi:hypothetical protein